MKNMNNIWKRNNEIWKYNNVKSENINVKPNKYVIMAKMSGNNENSNVIIMAKTKK